MSFYDMRAQQYHEWETLKSTPQTRPSTGSSSTNSSESHPYKKIFSIKSGDVIKTTNFLKNGKGLLFDRLIYKVGFIETLIMKISGWAPK